MPCGSCTACCTSSQFIHIGPDETDTLGHIPGELLFPAPGLPPGHVLLGHDERGHCPMLVDERCTIYAHRPATCRTYDCRVLPAAGVEADDDQPAHRPPGAAVALRPPDRHRPGRARRGAGRGRRSCATTPSVRELGSPRATQLAVLAVEIHDLFLAPRSGHRRGRRPVDPEADEVRVEVRRRVAG